MTYNKPLALIGLATLCIAPCSLMAHDLEQLAAPEHTHNVYLQAHIGQGKSIEQRDNNHTYSDLSGHFYSINAGVHVTPNVSVDLGYANGSGVIATTTSSGAKAKTDPYYISFSLKGQTAITSGTDGFANLGIAATNREHVTIEAGINFMPTSYYAIGTETHLSHTWDFIVKGSAVTGAFGTQNHRGTAPLIAVTIGFGCHS